MSTALRLADGSGIRRMATVPTLDADLTLPVPGTGKSMSGVGDVATHKFPGKTTSVPQVTAFNSKLYGTWSETTARAGQIRVVVYGGNDNSPSWSFVDGPDGLYGVNRASAHHAENPRLIVVGSTLYATLQQCI